jgi:hypothetical protein
MLVNVKNVNVKNVNVKNFQVVRMLLKLLEDKNGEVQNLAVR